MKDPESFDEYTDLVHQAIYEVDELRACIEDDVDEMQRYMPFIDQLDRQLRKHWEDLQADRHRIPSRVDMPFVDILQKYGRDIPFRELLDTINRFQKNGLVGGRG